MPAALRQTKSPPVQRACTSFTHLASISARPGEAFAQTPASIAFISKTKRFPLESPRVTPENAYALSRCERKRFGYLGTYDSRWSLVGAPTADATPRAHDHIAIYKRIGMAVPRIKDTERTFQAGTGSHVRRSPARVFFALQVELLGRWRYALAFETSGAESARKRSTPSLNTLSPTASM
jgi:hypothetical protein